MLFYIVALLLGFIGQIGAVFLLIHHSLLLAGIADLLVALFLSLVLWRALPARYREPKTKSVLFLWSLLIVAPVVATIGLITLIIAYHRPKKDQDELFRSYQIPDLPYIPISVSEEHNYYSNAGIQAVIKHAGESKKRLAAVMTTRNMDDEHSVPLLRLALSDLSDDVRLLAYSFLDGKENRLNKKIATNEELLTQTSSDTLKAYYQQKIAESYWELSYLGLAQGAVKDYVLTKATDYVLQSIELEPSNIKELFLGRIYLAHEKLDLAKKQFLKAREQGLDARRINPYMAEVAFAQQDYALCQNYLKQLPVEGMPAQLQQIREYWCDQASC
ncbi:protein PelE [Celerinatantimonas sp. MCCC 1A17872]|uniref:protein PelE n=1 Tax=Celerinatantimonas sp. MCCC 1A17872 TaxID=3177514 RepID=UPI0038C64659